MVREAGLIIRDWLARPSLKSYTAQVRSMDDHSITHRYDSFGDQYARLGFTDTYYLGFRDISRLIDQFKIPHGDALDHGCGSGRASRLLKQLGFRVVGVDRNASMVSHAQKSDPSGDYRYVPGVTLNELEDQSFNMIFQSSVLEEYPSTALMTETFREFHRILRPSGNVIIVTASEELPKGNWASFEYPDRERIPKSGEKVRCVVRNSNIVFSDYYWTDTDLRSVFEVSEFELLTLHQPLATGDEPYKWIDELKRPAWSVYVLKKKAV